MTLFFIHGAGCTAETFSAQTAAFPNGAALELPGHDGGSDTPASIGEFADFIERRLAGRPARSVVLCGHSMGGAIALETALRDPAALRGVVLIGSGARLRVAPALFESLARDFPAAARDLAERFFFAAAEPGWIARAVAQMERVGAAQTIRDFRACDAFDAVERLSELRVPLLALTGDGDALVPAKYATFIADRVPEGAARIIGGAGHFAMVERPDETNALISAFVAQLDR